MMHWASSVDVSKEKVEFEMKKRPDGSSHGLAVTLDYYVRQKDIQEL